MASFSFTSYEPLAGKHTLRWSKASEAGNESVLRIFQPVVLESVLVPNPTSPDGERAALWYDSIKQTASGYEAQCEFDANGVRGTITDVWTTGASSSTSASFTVSRSVKIDSVPERATPGLRVGLLLQPAFPEGVGFNDLEYYAPNACYNLNDLNEDGVCDYLDAQALSYRDDRLNALSVLAYHPRRHLAFALSRADVPKYDDQPVREKGQLSFLQDTDIGALGFQPASPQGQQVNDALLTAFYPFVERDRCNALLVQERPPWGAFRPVEPGQAFTVSYTVRIYSSPSAHAALWTLIKDQIRVLQPKPVVLDKSPDEISRLRLDALAKYFKEDAAGGAGFVTNCHPQDGVQLGNIVQYGKPLITNTTRPFL
jgi:hypothetical protein